MLYKEMMQTSIKSVASYEAEEVATSFFRGQKYNIDLKLQLILP